ncbi:MAG TPA: hypothetical protein PK402_13290 [Tepidisphaeraceae bacterium]|nr:hypothetical protein [Tepidisphaeraceae bacterium]
MRNAFDAWRLVPQFGLGLATLVFIAGCEESSNPPTPAPTTSTAQTSASANSKAAHRVRLEISDLTVEVPGDWDVEPDALAKFNVLRGPLPAGDPEITALLAHPLGTIDQHEDISSERAVAMIEQFKKEGEKDDIDVSVYEHGSLTTVEIARRAPSVTTQPTDKVETLVQLTYHLFGPSSDGKKISGEIRFPHMTVSEYEAERETLTKIIKSLQLSPPTTSPSELETP